MIIDVTGIELIPGNLGKDCPGNGETKDKNGNLIECCCDECDCMLCCLETHDKKSCETCDDTECPHSPNVDGALPPVSQLYEVFQIKRDSSS